MIISGIAVISNDMLIGKHKDDSPVYWASSSDQNFYINHMKEMNPLCIMGYNTYMEVKRIPEKDHMYGAMKSIVLNSNIEYNNNDIHTPQYMHISDNPNHIYATIYKDNIKNDMKYYSNLFNKSNAYILGGSAVYDMFIDDYDIFYLSHDKSINLKGSNANNEIPLFSNHIKSSIEEIIDLFNMKNMILSSKSQLCENVDLYIFKK